MVHIVLTRPIWIRRVIAETVRNVIKALVIFKKLKIVVEMIIKKINIQTNVIDETRGMLSIERTMIDSKCLAAAGALRNSVNIFIHSVWLTTVAESLACVGHTENYRLLEWYIWWKIVLDEISTFNHIVPY